MIVSIGLDAVEINRFLQWHTYSSKQLERVFSPTEIQYCLSNQLKTAERCAARFAAKEALYKALSQLNAPLPPFLKLCSITEIIHMPAPTLAINNDDLNKHYKFFLTITHTSTTAIALVIVQSCMRSSQTPDIAAIKS